MKQTTSILQLPPGSSGSINSIRNMSPILRRRLSDLGVLEGSIISLKHRGPFGGPVTLECNGQLFGIRLREAKEIEVCIS